LKEKRGNQSYKKYGETRLFLRINSLGIFTKHKEFLRRGPDRTQE